MPNRLAQETSPYLLQHADNPVDWLPWGEEALALARKLDKPILLSIGYSACHWCHVMAHESFEDADVAAVMNTNFVNIKVDREERPDLDHIYQHAHQIIARRGGGWPLTMFLSPEQAPFFSGTYFPKEPRHQMPGLLELLPKVADYYHKNKAEIAAQNPRLVEALESVSPKPDANAKLALAPLDDAARDLAGNFDRIWGGFGREPKFPRPTELEFCMRYAAAKDRDDVGEMAVFTLHKMEQGGIYDQLGGGFCRYSVDAQWAIPHFEKMLYDNGPLLGLYADAYALTGHGRFRQVVQETVGWLTREMRDAAGGFYSALDADSEHEEGKFYVWTPEEVRVLLTPDEFALVSPHYGLDLPPNFEGKHWHFIIAKPLEEVAESLKLSNESAQQVLASTRQKLSAARAKRVRPGRDDKVLTSWNALMIKGLAHAGRVFGQSSWVSLAQQAVDFIRREMWVEGRLLATYKDGRARLNAYLDDYAFLLDALLELMQTEFRPQDVRFAQDLAERLLAQFEDAERGGFFFTGHDHETLLHRPKPGHDQATPSGNGVAALSLQRLGHVLGEARYLAASERALTSFYPGIAAQPAGYTTLLMTLKENLAPPDIVAVRGPAAEMGVWREALAASYLPNALAFFVPNGMQDLPAALAKPETPTVNAWVCKGVNCLPAVATPEALIALCKDAADV
jgi:hypothetical protein